MRPVLFTLALVLLILPAAGSNAPDQTAVTIHCCSQGQIDICRDTCRAQHCKASIGCRAGECNCVCVC